MAKSKGKAKAKSNFDFKKVLLAKGEYIALGVAGFFLLVMLFMGVSALSDAKDPEAISKGLTAKASTLAQSVNSTNINPEDEKQTELPKWVVEKYEYPRVGVSAFPLSGRPFDTTGSPGTKRENPLVLRIDKYQADLIRAPMKAYDIRTDNQGNTTIGVVVSQKVSAQDKEGVAKLREKFKARPQRRPAAPVPAVAPLPPGGAPFGGPFGGVGRFQSAPVGDIGRGFDTAAERKGIEYVPLDNLDAAIAAGKKPAMTVVPLRMVIVHAEVPWKAQLEEIKRALRFKTLQEAALWGPIYDGYEVRRKVTKKDFDGKDVTIQDWADYKFEDKYAELIWSRKLADNIEDGYMAHFLRYDMALALPLPQLVPELGAYPPINKLPGIQDTIEKLKKAEQPQVTQSELQKRLQRLGVERIGLYSPATADATGARSIFGADNFGGVEQFPRPKGGVQPPVAPGAAPPGYAFGPGGQFRFGEQSNQGYVPPIEIENLLLRFVDVDVQPGLTYQYQIRLRMLNPNLGQTKLVANPHFATVKELFSPWTQISNTLTVPQESFMYAADVAAYRKKIDEEYADHKDLRDRLQLSNTVPQAVVEMSTWMEQVRLDSGGQHREPVGAFVVADIPVGRGELIGRKQYLKLPLWSSESNQYTLREVPDVLPGRSKTKPKGWLVDFSTRALLADFEGGRVRTVVGNRSVTEDVGTEMLIVAPDGKLTVKYSLVDDANEDRKERVASWEKWVKQVETQRPAGEKNEFDRPRN